MIPMSLIGQKGGQYRTQDSVCNRDFKIYFSVGRGADKDLDEDNIIEPVP